MSAETLTAKASASGWSRWRPFVRHYLEMVVTMGLGMVVLHPVWLLALQLAAAPHALDNNTLRALIMATNMSVGMGAWMCYRGHRWRTIVEMSATMYLSFAVFFPALWAGAVTGAWMMVGGHNVMLPAMLAVMLWRRDEYMVCYEKHTEH